MNEQQDSKMNAMIDERAKDKQKPMVLLPHYLLLVNIEHDIICM
jgi:hypothetical protein